MSEAPRRTAERRWIELLSPAECWRRLRLSPIGRLAVDAGEPMIWPLNIAVDGEAVVFRTGAGEKLADLDTATRAAIEVDGLDLDAETGWSVVAVGRLRPLEGEALVRAARLPLRPWTVGAKPRWYALQVDRITGRAIGGHRSGPPPRTIT